jgi:ribosomal-protein-serine acetyltransferase
MLRIGTRGYACTRMPSPAPTRRTTAGESTDAAELREAGNSRAEMAWHHHRLFAEGAGVGAGTLVADEDVELRPVTEALKPSLVEAVIESHAHLSPWMFWAKEDYDLQDAGFFVDMVASGAERAYAITNRAGGCFHGLCSLNRVDELNRTANLGYWLRATSTGRGLATRAARALLVHAFEHLQMERVEIVTSPANAASVRLAQRLGLHEEGLRGRAIRLRDAQHDARVFAAFVSDLERLRQTPAAAG